MRHEVGGAVGPAFGVVQFSGCRERRCCRGHTKRDGGAGACIVSRAWLALAARLFYVVGLL